MDQELIKQLEEAGFNNHLCKACAVKSCQFSHEPTLSELITACGNRFGALLNTESDDKWEACGDVMGPATHYDSCYITYGKTPEEAVAKLWLALKKENEQR